MSAIDNVLAELRDRGEVVLRGKDWHCLCPAHDDKTPSLDVSVGRDGRVLLCCRSRGCSAASIAAALGLSMRDLFNGPMPNTDKLSFDERVLATYDYKDEKGTVLFQTVRLWEPPPKNKDFRQRRPDGKGEWIWKLDDVRRVLYRLPELLAADPLDLVFIPEGEKDVDNCHRLGLTATTNPMGAGKWRKEYAEFLRGRRVVVLPDNDESGQKHAVAVNASLTGVAASVRILQLPGLPPKGDVSDWLADGGTAARLRELVQAPLPAKATNQGSRFKFEDISEILARDSRPRWLVEKQIVRGEPGVIAGPSKGMKTSTAIDLAVSLATMTPFLGKFAVPERVRVAFVSGESGENTTKETIRRVLASKGLATDAANGWLKVEFTLPKLIDTDSMADFGDHIARVEADVVMLDPTYLCLGGGVEHSNMFDMGEALRGVGEYLKSRRPDLTVFFTHHANRKLAIGEPMELQHLAYSGLEQFARRWILLNRRESYGNDGTHALWMRIGGSAGGGGLWGLDIDEGEIDEDFQGRKWGVKVLKIDEVKEAVSTGRESAKRDAKLDQKHRDENEVLAVIDAERNHDYPGASMSWIGDHVSFGEERAKSAVRRLMERGAIVKVDEFQKPSGNGAKVTVRNGYGRSSPEAFL